MVPSTARSTSKANDMRAPPRRLPRVDSRGEIDGARPGRQRRDRDECARGPRCSGASTRGRPAPRAVIDTRFCCVYAEIEESAAEVARETLDHGRTATKGRRI